MEAMASAGVTTPATQDVAWITSREHPWHRASRDAPVEPGDLVAFEAGVILGGYVGELGRTHSVDGDAAIDRELSERWDELWDRLLAACRVGRAAERSPRRLRRRGDPAAPHAGGARTWARVRPSARDAALPRTAGEQHVEAGMVLALTAYVWKEGIGAVYGQEPVVVTRDRAGAALDQPVPRGKEPLT